jgi:hypothetical protein
MGNLENSNENLRFIERMRKIFNRLKRKKYVHAPNLCRVNLVERRFLTKEEIDAMLEEFLKLKFD